MDEQPRLKLRERARRYIAKAILENLLMKGGGIRPNRFEPVVIQLTQHRPNPAFRKQRRSASQDLRFPPFDVQLEEVDMVKPELGKALV